VDFELSADQEALRDAAAALLDGVSDPSAVRSHVDAGGGLDNDLWKAMIDQGWPGVAVDEDVGGLGLGWVEVAVLLEQTGAHLAAVPFLQQVVALDALQAADQASVEGVRDVIERLVSGDRIAVTPWRALSAERDGDGWSLRGSTEPVIFAPDADVVVVPALLDGSREPSLFLVDAPMCARQPAMDLTRTLGWLSFHGAPATRLGGAAAASRHLDSGATAHALELLGCASRAMDLTVQYAKEREQFGRPIGSFQAVKHRCADMLVDVEGMRSAAFYAAWTLAADDSDRSVAASTAKAWCSDAAKRVMSSALQVHGGIGFTWECDVHFFLKRAQLDQVAFGDAVFHRDRLSTLLRERVAAGLSVI
jgi:alkylation response protein AidB-like acyl-CoA dehydrogenase